MPRETAFDPVMSRTGTTKIAAPPVARVQEIALDPVCRSIGTTQTATPPVAT